MSPGPGALQAAIDAAQPGDTLRILAGTYDEAIVITKPLKLLGVPYGESVPTIDAGCGSSTAVTIAANDVSLTTIVVQAVAGPYGIDIQDRDNIRLLGVDVLATPQTCSPAEACINVERSSHVTLGPHVEACGGTNPIGIRLAEIASDANVRVTRVSAFGQENALVIENSGANAPPAGARILVRKSVLVTAVGAVAGVSFMASDGVTLRTSHVFSAVDVPVVRRDAFSDNNFSGHNLFGGGAPVDDGTGNCWRRNDPDVFGCP